jgi:hypothetical protein
MSLDNQTKELAGNLILFMKKKFGFDRLPAISFIDSKKNSSNHLCMTGGYNQEAEEISVYITDRHPKDILRSLAHEMLHHVQKCEGKFDGKDTSITVNPNYIMYDKFLKNIEADAFERGNICFREWEATKKGDKTMSESKKSEKKMSKPEITAKHKKAKEAMPSFIDQYGKKEGERIAYATAMSGKMDEELELEEAAKPDFLDLDKDGNKKEPMKKAAKDAKKEKIKEEKEVKVNEALKNSHNYSTVTRALPEVAAARDEFIFKELIRKFNIKK